MSQIYLVIRMVSQECEVILTSKVVFTRTANYGNGTIHPITGHEGPEEE
jgi:hypothetical protein